MYNVMRKNRKVATNHIFYINRCASNEGWMDLTSCFRNKLNLSESTSINTSTIHLCCLVRVVKVMSVHDCSYVELVKHEKSTWSDGQKISDASLSDFISYLT